MLVLEHAVEDQEFLAAAMDVGRESGCWGIADDAGGAGDLVADPVEHAAVDPGRRRRAPGQRAPHGQRRAGE